MAGASRIRGGVPCLRLSMLGHSVVFVVRVIVVVVVVVVGGRGGAGVRQ